MFVDFLFIFNRISTGNQIIQYSKSNSTNKKEEDRTIQFSTVNYHDYSIVEQTQAQIVIVNEKEKNGTYVKGVCFGKASNNCTLQLNLILIIVVIGCSGILNKRKSPPHAHQRTVLTSSP